MTSLPLNEGLDPSVAISADGAGTRDALWLLDRALAGVCIGLLAVSLASMVGQVFLRYVAGTALHWTEEVSRFSFIWLIFLGAALGIRSGEHIAMDTVISRLPAPIRRAVAMAVRATIGAVSALLGWYGWQVTGNATNLSPALEVPMTFVYAAVPVGAGLMLINLLRALPGERWHPVERVVPPLVGIIAALSVLAMGSIAPPELDSGTVLLLSTLGLLALGVPVAFAIALSAVLALWAGSAGVPLTVVPHQMVNSLNSFLILAVPFFLLAGHLMEAGGITRRIIDLASALVGHVTGGLSHVNVLSNAFMGGISGSSLSDAAAISRILVPSMERYGYSRGYACAVTASSSVLAQLIPPSISMLIYAAVASASVGRLFLAGILPAAVVTLSLLVVGHFLCVQKGYRGLERRATPVETWRATRSALWALGMPVIVLGGMRLGVTTPTEASGVAVLYALFVGTVVYRELAWRDIPRLALAAGLQSAAVLFILGASQPFSWLITVEQIPQQAAALLVGISDNSLFLLLLANLLLLIVGLPLEVGPAMIMVTPILLPIMLAVGVDPVHFGVIMVTNLIIGSLTPPVGLLVFVTAGIARIEPMIVFREALPFLVALLAALLVITFVPWLSLALPDLLMGPG